MLRLRLGISLVYTGLEDADVRQIAVALRIVQAITHDELIGYAKALVVHFDVFDALALFIEQSADTQAEGIAPLEHIYQVMQSQTAIDDIFDNQQVLLINGAFKILEDAYDATGLGGVTITGDGHIIKFDEERHRSCQVGDKRDRTFEGP